MVANYSNSQNLKTLRLKWGLAVLSGLVCLAITYSWLLTWWENPYPTRWLIIAGLALAYLLWVLWKGLGDNHHPERVVFSPNLGLGNLISIGRGYILVFFCGFIFSPWPEGGWKSWLPGFLFTLAALLDYLDGAAARWTNQVTKLGQTLDISIDSIAVLSVTLLAVQYGQVPWWYLPVGLARYIFLAAIWLRATLGLPVYELAYSIRRRGYAGLTMGLFFVVLYPPFTPPGTYVAATVFALYLLGGFVWDWLVTIGWLPTQPGEAYLRLENFAVRYIPLAIRVVLIIWGLTALLPDLWLTIGSGLSWLEVVVVMCLILGIAGRVASIAGLVLLGIRQVAAPLDAWQLGLIVLYTNLLFLGTGDLSLWPVENRIIFRHLGD